MSYNASITVKILDKEHTDKLMDTIGRIRAKSKEASLAIDEYGRPTGNEGGWRGFGADLEAITLELSGLHLQVDIMGEEHYVNRFYFFGGGVQECKPSLRYPIYDVQKLVPAPRLVTREDKSLQISCQWKKSSASVLSFELVWTLGGRFGLREASDQHIRDFFSRQHGTEEPISGPLRMHHFETYYEMLTDD